MSTQFCWQGPSSQGEAGCHFRSARVYLARKSHALRLRNTRAKHKSVGTSPLRRYPRLAMVGELADWSPTPVGSPGVALQHRREREPAGTAFTELQSRTADEPSGTKSLHSSLRGTAEPIRTNLCRV